MFLISKTLTGSSVGVTAQVVSSKSHLFEINFNIVSTKTGNTHILVSMCFCLLLGYTWTNHSVKGDGFLLVYIVYVPCWFYVRTGMISLADDSPLHQQSTH